MLSAGHFVTFLNSGSDVLFNNPHGQQHRKQSWLLPIYSISFNFSLWSFRYHAFFSFPALPPDSFVVLRLLLLLLTRRFQFQFVLSHLQSTQLLLDFSTFQLHSRTEVNAFPSTFSNFFSSSSRPFQFKAKLSNPRRWPSASHCSTLEQIFQSFMWPPKPKDCLVSGPLEFINARPRSFINARPRGSMCLP